MRFAAFVIIFTLGASSAWARVGETAQEAEKRYGTPVQTETNTSDNTVSRRYSKGGIDIVASFYVNKSGVSVIGQILYGYDGDHSTSEEVFGKLLQANAQGEEWVKVSGSETPPYEYRRKGAKAIWRWELHVTLDEYVAYTTAAEADTARKEAEKLKKEREGF